VKEPVMEILVDAVPLTGLQTGIGRYVRNLYRALEQSPELSARCRIHYFDGRVLRRHPPAAANPARWTALTDALWKLPDPAVVTLRAMHWLNYERRLRRVCRSGRYDIYHETSFFPAAQTTVPTVFNIFDFSLERYAHTHPRERVWFHRLFFRRRLAYADHILTLSRFVLEEVRSRLALTEDQVSAVPLAPDPVFRPVPPQEVDRVRRRFGLDGPYLLFVGSLEPRKNLRGVLKAWRRMERPTALVLTGWQAWGDKKWLQAPENGSQGSADRNHPHPVLTGYVDDATLAALYTGATALVYPSLYEGFGLPIVEAMACGCPVVCSRTSSMPEVAGDAALLVDPRNADELAAALDRVVGDEAVRRELVQRGLERACHFTWKKTAQATLHVFRRTAERGPCRLLSSRIS